MVAADINLKRTIRSYVLSTWTIIRRIRIWSMLASKRDSWTQGEKKVDDWSQAAKKDDDWTQINKSNT